MTSPSMTTLALKTLLAFSLVLIAGCMPIKEQLFDWGLAGERALSNLTLKDVQVGEQRWAYLDSGQTGDSRPVVLLLHGFAVDKDNWLRFARHLSEYRVIAPDLPGHGGSSFDPYAIYSFSQQSVWLAQFIEQLALPPLHLVGNSMGGGIALLLAEQRPQALLSLTLMDAAGVFPPERSEFQRLLEDDGDNPLVIRSAQDFAQLQALALEKPPFLPWPAAEVLASRAMARSDINHKIFDDIHAEAEGLRGTDENLKRLQRINLPVLIIWGQQDRILDVSSVAVFRQYLSDSEAHILPGVGHAPMLEVPQLSATLFKRFIERS